MTVSQLVQLADDPVALARRLRRPLPFPPNPSTRRGTAFHSLAGAALRRAPAVGCGRTARRRRRGRRTGRAARRVAYRVPGQRWGERTPVDVEIAFETEIAGVTLRGRMDAVYADADGGWTVVDWKTGAVPDAERLPALSVQLAAYRLALSALRGVPLVSVRAAFHYVAANRTVRPVDLLDAEGLRELIGAVPVEPD